MSAEEAAPATRPGSEKTVATDEAKPQARTAESERRGLSAGGKNEPSPQEPGKGGSPSPPAGQMAGGAPQQGRQQPSEESKPSAAGKPSASDPPPGDAMSRRMLDVAQSSSSQRMRLKVDQWAGSFSGQQRRKLEVAIAPKLAALDEALAKAERTSQGVLDEIGAGAEWRAAHDREISSAEQASESGQKLIEELESQTKDSPYAFIGLQVSDIGIAHVEPARSALWTALKSDGEGRVASVRDAHQHLVRARQLVAELRGKFERSKREFQLAESVERVKKMYQVYVENAMTMLPTSPDEGNRYRRKMAEFELNDEYLKRLQEVLKMREELRAELARILADDPRLLRRLMDSIRNRSENLREELAALVADQQEFNREVRAWSETEAADRPRIAQLLLMRQLRKSAEIAAAAGELQDRYQAWLPLDRKSKDGNLAGATESIQQLATAANQLSEHSRQFIADATSPKLAAPAEGAATATPTADSAAGGEAKPQAAAEPVANNVPSVEALLTDGQKVYEVAVQLETKLRQLSASDDDLEIASFGANRLADTRNVIASASAWVRQVRAHQADKYPRAAEVEQYRLAMKTDELAGKLGSIEQSLSDLLQRRDGSLPEPIAVKAREFIAALDKEASPNQLAAVYALHVDDMPRATERQLLAGGALEKAEKLYDEMMKLAIAEVDKLPVQDPIANLLDDPTLDELLARLEQEQQMQQLLGIPPRPTNLRIVDDWLTQSGNLATAMRSRAWMQQQMKREDERMRRQLDQAYRRAVARALKESTQGKRIALPRRTKLADWNKLLSQLNDDVGQGRDKAPPEQYRRAIEQYFSQISKEVADEEEKPQ
jgi:hypothetical protein